MAESVLIFDPNVFLGKIDYHNRCSDSPVWHGWYPKLRVAVFAIYLVFYVFLIPALVFFTRRRSARAKSILGWWYGAAVVSMIIYLLFALIGDSLLNCLKIGDLKYLKLYTAVNVFRNIAQVIILGVICLLVIPLMMKHARFNRPSAERLVTPIFLGLLFFVSIFCLVHLVFWNYDDIHSFTGGHIVDRKNGVTSTYVTLYFVTCLAAASIILASCLTGMNKKLSLRGIFSFGGLLAISLIGFSIVDMIVIFGWKVHVRTWTKSASISFGIVNIFFQGCMFIFVVIQAMSKALADDEVANAHTEKNLRNESQSTTHETTNSNQI